MARSYSDDVFILIVEIMDEADAIKLIKTLLPIVDKALNRSMSLETPLKDELTREIFKTLTTAIRNLSPLRERTVTSADFTWIQKNCGEIMSAFSAKCPRESSWASSSSSTSSQSMESDENDESDCSANVMSQAVVPYDPMFAARIQTSSHQVCNVAMPISTPFPETLVPHQRERQNKTITNNVPSSTVIGRGRARAVNHDPPSAGIMAITPRPTTGENAIGRGRGRSVHTDMPISTVGVVWPARMTRDTSNQCWNCGVLGHNYSKCLQPLSINRFCYTCGEKGYTVKKCPNCSEWWKMQGGSYAYYSRDSRLRGQIHPQLGGGTPETVSNNMSKPVTL